MMTTCWLYRLLWGGCLLAALFFASRNPALAQAKSCGAQVHFGNGGTDQGDCRDAETGLCATHDYALAQGLQQCSSLVQIFEDGMLVDMYITPPPVERTPVDWLIIVVYWLAPLVLGGVGGWLLGNRRLASPRRRSV